MWRSKTDTVEMFCSNIDIDFDYRGLTTNKSGGKMVQVSTVPGSSDWNDKIRFQMCEDEKTNLQTTVWPLSTPMQGQDPTRRQLELTVESPALKTFLSRLDNRNIDIASEKSQEWFKKSLDRATIEGMYIQMCKDPAKEGDKSTVKVKVNCGDVRPTNIYMVTATDEQGNMTYVKGTHEDLTKGVKALVLVETNGLWFMNRTFGMSLNATEILIWPQRRAITGINAFSLSKDARLRETNSDAPEDMDM